ncbi:MAG: dihydroxyacetone kinase phosphoryl donor subunit DhaM [Eubacteriales bacterium]|jgi:dihydroxyacetone kinase phosphotransfer subunit|nr:PTS-dependent dihydroxyacetone kinase phosphotransferase subunit DhaM [Lachnospiraceae bacterium]
MVGIVIVSHSWKVAEGIYDLAMQMAAENEHIFAAGGMEDGSIGTDAMKIQEAIEKADTGDGVAVLADLGSGIMSAEMAIEMLESDINVRIADAPILEGAISAAVTSTSGASLDEVIEAAEEARTASKLS